MQAENLARDEILAHAGLSSEVAVDLSQRIALPVADRLWEEAARRSGDPCFALTTAMMVSPGLYDVAEYAARKHPTLGEGLRVFVRFIGLLHDLARIRFVERPQAVTLLYEMADGVPPPRVWTEHVLTAFVLVGRQVTGSSWAPVEVSFVHAAHCDAQRFKQVLGVTPRFNERHNTIVIPRSAWNMATIEADPRLAGILSRYAEALLERHDSAGVVARRVQEVIAASLDGAGVTIESTAKRLDMSVHALRRGLRDEGTTHRELLDDLRCRLATRYLLEGRWTTEEVAFLTGFSATSAFVRAFRRWTGQSVSVFTSAARAGS
jgi:AraC-like DNA-binding protein